MKIRTKAVRFFDFRANESLRYIVVQHIGICKENYAIDQAEGTGMI